VLTRGECVDFVAARPEARLKHLSRECSHHGQYRDRKKIPASQHDLDPICPCPRVLALSVSKSRRQLRLRVGLAPSARPAPDPCSCPSHFDSRDADTQSHATRHVHLQRAGEGRCRRKGGWFRRPRRSWSRPPERLGGQRQRKDSRRPDPVRLSRSRM
jgi:hypothetical protein